MKTKNQPFKVDVREGPLGGWTWSCRTCGEIGGIVYVYEERAEEKASEHVREEHGPRVVINTIPFHR